MPRTNLSDLIERQNGSKGARVIIGEILMEMKLRKITQSEMARLIGLSPAVFSNRVKGCDFRLDELVRISNVLKDDIRVHG